MKKEELSRGCPTREDGRTCPEEHRTDTTYTPFIKNSLVRERHAFLVESGRMKEKLKFLILDDKIHSVGLFNQWCQKFWYLNEDHKNQLWKELGEQIDHETFREIFVGFKEYAEQQKQFMTARRNRRRFPCK